MPDKCHELSGPSLVGTVGTARLRLEARGRSGRLIGGGAILYSEVAHKCLICSQSLVVSQLKSFLSYTNLLPVLHPFAFAPCRKHQYSISSMNLIVSNAKNLYFTCFSG